MKESSLDFALSDGERISPFWARFKAYLELKLEESRKKNDDVSLDEKATAEMRGQIRCLKALIALGNERPIVKVNRE